MILHDCCQTSAPLHRQIDAHVICCRVVQPCLSVDCPFVGCLYLELSYEIGPHYHIDLLHQKNHIQEHGSLLGCDYFLTISQVRVESGPGSG